MQAAVLLSSVFTEPEPGFNRSTSAVQRTAQKPQTEALHQPGWEEQQRDTGSKAELVQSDVLPTVQPVPTQLRHKKLHDSHIFHDMPWWSFYFHQSAKMH